MILYNNPFCEMIPTTESQFRYEELLLRLRQRAPLV
jgi:hypothetical protein